MVPCGLSQLCLQDWNASQVSHRAMLAGGQAVSVHTSLRVVKGKKIFVNPKLCLLTLHSVINLIEFPSLIFGPLSLTSSTKAL